MGVEMTDHVWLSLRRNRGWPWPEESWGLSPMFGEHGWCRSCGLPLVTQNGSIVLRPRGMAPEGAWVPNWRFDAICMEGSLAEIAGSQFDLETRQVEWRGAQLRNASQIVAPSVGQMWFDPDDLRQAAVSRHGVDGALCADCGTWRWMPLAFEQLPALQDIPGLEDVDIAASPEWFGDGMKSFRQILVRRKLAMLLVSGSPRDFSMVEPR